MSLNVVEFKKEEDLSAEQILDEFKEFNASEVLILGWDENDELQFDSNMKKLDAVWIMETLKHKLVKDQFS